VRKEEDHAATGNGNGTNGRKKKAA
jgi:hypothetical protein